MNKEPETLCDFAKLQYLDARRWRNLWSVLVYVFGITIVLFLVTAILLFINNTTWLPAALTTFGTIVSSVGVTWVINQRVTAVEEEKEAFLRLKETCQPGMGIMGIEQQAWFMELRMRAWKSLLWPEYMNKQQRD